MSYSDAQLAALGRLLNFYNGDLPFDASTNPGGFRRGGQVVNFDPALKDIAAVANGVGTVAQEVAAAIQQALALYGSAAALTAAVQSAQQSLTDARAARDASQQSAQSASGSATAAAGSAGQAATSAGAAAASATSAAQVAPNRTYADLIADTSPDVGTIRQVSVDPNSGTYELRLVNGTKTWVRTGATVPGLDARTQQISSLTVPGFSEVVTAGNGSAVRATRDSGETVLAALQFGDFDTVQQQVSADASGMLLSGIVSALLSNVTGGLQDGTFLNDSLGNVMASYVQGLLTMPQGYGIGTDVKLSWVDSGAHLFYITDKFGNVIFELDLGGAPNYTTAPSFQTSSVLATDQSVFFTDSLGNVLFELGLDGTPNYPGKSATPIVGDPTPLLGPELFLAPGQTLKLYPRNLIEDCSGTTPIMATLASEANQGGGWQLPCVEEGTLSLSLDPARLGSTALLSVRPAGADASPRREVSLSLRKAAVPYAAQRTPKVLAFGDSITDRELAYWVGGRLSTWNVAPQFIGTQSSLLPSGVTGETRTEAHSGWRLGDFTNRTGAKASVPVGGEAAYLAGSRADRQAANPLLRDATASDPASIIRNGKVFDVRFYLNRFSLPDPDIVLVEAGTNDASGAGTLAGLQPAFSQDMDLVLAQIRAALPNTIILLWYPASPREAIQLPAYQSMRASILRDFVGRARSGADAKLHVVSAWASMTLETGWSLSTASPDPVTGVTSASINDFLHPQGAARQQMADAIAAAVAFYS